MVLYLLSNFDHPDWNLKHARETIDFETVAERCIEKFESTEALKEFRANDIFTKCAKRLKQIKVHLATKRRYPQVNLELNSGLETVSGHNQVPDYSPFDDDWLRDFMEPWDNQFIGMENQNNISAGQDRPNSDPGLGIIIPNCQNPNY